MGKPLGKRVADWDNINVDRKEVGHKDGKRMELTYKNVFEVDDVEPSGSATRELVSK
jgi:hypothetical protein